ncbi:PEBP-like protein [Cucurbitaria berberidis CBS 394.84]|uniref:PEBP-like protein n=1 Tax=Cucurbitaria berberidis CBS 394.84 TaxID=1168544 RepID=A0A9P4GNU7_9PLEO|nr:PEBP-like protein [Cucurbitaria berberidis CBS 394.84]KAF1849000.1 PEBP-like protein [Cucurbitaria berberidis CBS 394.84]
MFLLKVLEYCIGRLLYRLRGYDELCFFRSRAFAQHAKPNITITSPDCGNSGAKLSNDFSKFGIGRFPSLQWERAGPDVKQYLILTEDPDAPLRKPNVHGIYLFIPPTVTSITNDDLKLVDDVDGVKTVQAGYRVGKNRRNAVYVLPRPPLGHGPHRYFFEVVALSECLDPGMISKVPTKDELEEAIVGKVVGWGLWEATYEQKW